MNLSEAIKGLNQLIEKSQYEQMVHAAAIITKLLESENIRPIVVGGLSVNLYTQNNYATRDIDFVSDGFEKISRILSSLGFEKDGRHFYHADIEVAIEIPSSYLDGDYDKVVKVEIDNDKYIYLISIEDIIHDRLKAAVHWSSLEDREWGFKLLTGNFNDVDLAYLYNKLETVPEQLELDLWIEKIKSEVTEDSI